MLPAFGLSQAFLSILQTRDVHNKRRPKLPGRRRLSTLALLHSAATCRWQLQPKVAMPCHGSGPQGEGFKMCPHMKYSEDAKQSKLT